MVVHFETAGMKLYEETGYPFLVAELSGMLQADDFSRLLSDENFFRALKASGKSMVLLELNDVYVIGTQTIEYIMRDFAAALKNAGVVKFSLSVASHIFSMFAMMAGPMEKNAAIPVKSFADINESATWLMQA